MEAENGKSKPIEQDRTRYESYGTDVAGTE